MAVFPSYNALEGVCRKDRGIIHHACVKVYAGIGLASSNYAIKIIDTMEENAHHSDAYMIARF